MLFRIDITKLKRSVTTLIVLLITACLISGSFVVPVSAAINQEINYQGKLTDSGGTAVADGAYSVVYKLYTVSSGGVAIWTETQSVTATNGLFSVMLGSVTPLSSVDFNQTLYLGVNVGGDGEMTPRKTIGSVPAAFTADKLDNLDSTDFVLTSATSLPNLWSLTGLGQIGSSTATTTFLGRLAVTGNSIVAGLFSAYQTITAPNFVATSSTASVFPYASSTAITVSGTASTTNLIVSNTSQLGTVTSGTWNGSVIGDAYLTKSGDWSGTLDGQDGSFYLNASNLTNFGTPFYNFFSATTTDALAEGSTNKYWSNTLFDNRLSASSSISGITTLPNLSLSASQLTNFGTPFYTFFNATTTDALAEGLTNKYWSNTLFDNRLSATTSLPNVWSLTGLGQIGSSTATTTFLGRLAVTGNSIVAGLFSAYQTITAPNFVATSSTASVFPYASSTAITVSGTASTTNLIVSSLGGTASSCLYADSTGLIDGTGAACVGSQWDDVAGGVNYAGGNVGIGSSTPFAKLSVDGEVRFQGENFATTTIGNFASNLTIGAIDSFLGKIPFMRSLTNAGPMLVNKGYLYLQEDLDTGYLPSLNFISDDFSSLAEITFSTTTGALDISSSATTTANRGLNISSGCFAIDGVCISGGGSPGGNPNSIQFNNGGSFDGSDNLTWDGSNLSVTGFLGLNGSLYVEELSELYGGSETRRYIGSDASGIASFNALHNDEDPDVLALLGVQNIAGDLSPLLTNNSYTGVQGITRTSSSTADAIGIYGYAQGGANTYAGYFDGLLFASSTRVGSLAGSGTAIVCTDNNGLLIVGGCGSGASQWDDVTGGINYAGGNVGIGSSTPYAKLAVIPDSKYGSEEITNNGFTGSATGWTLGTDWAYDTDNITHTPGTTDVVTQAGTLSTGVDYKVQVVMSGGSAGSVDVCLDGGTCVNLDYDTPGFIAWTGTWSNTDGVKVSITPSSDYDGSVDSISIKEVLDTGPAFAIDNEETYSLSIDRYDLFPLFMDVFNIPLLTGKSKNSYFSDSDVIGVKGSLVILAPDQGSDLLGDDPVIKFWDPSSFSSGSIAYSTTTQEFTIQQSGATTTIDSDYINLTGSGCYAVNGVCITGGSSQWVTSGNDIFYHDGNVGILNDSATTFVLGSADGMQLAGLGYSSSTDVLSFTSATGGYSFDNDVSVTGDFTASEDIHSLNFNVSQYGGYKQNGATILTASSTNFGTFAGIGAGTISNGTNCISNTAFGYNALHGYSSSCPSYDTAIGYGALASSSVGSNVAVGYSALGLNYSGVDNVAIGMGALAYTTVNVRNIAIGNNAAPNGGGNKNIVIGTNASQSGLGDETIIIGDNANAAGNRNVILASGRTDANYVNGAFGSFDNNINIGYKAGTDMRGGSFNLIIGQNAAAVSTTTNQQLNIGNVIWGTGIYGGSTMSSSTVANSKIGIGTTTPFAKLSVSSVVGDTMDYLFQVASSTAGSLFQVDKSGYVGIGTTSPWGMLSVNPNGISGPAFVVGSSTATSFLVTNGGKVLIGTTTPYNAADTLTVDGSVRVLENHLLAIGGSRMLAASTTRSNFYFGPCGNTLNLGGSNTCLGFGNLTPNTDGIQNTAIGNGALLTATADGNTALGYLAGGSQGLGSDNIMIGRSVNVVDTDGSNQLNIGDAIYGTGLYTPNVNIGIGSSTPWATLAVNPDVGSSNMFVVGSSTGGTKFIINGAGNVGIGTSTPTGMLDAYANGVFSLNAINAATLGVASGGLIGARTALDPTAADQRLGGLFMGSPTLNGVAVVGYSDGSWAANDTPGYLSFQTAPDGSSTRLERMRIGSTGNVGIGTTTPWATLAVNPEAGSANMFVVGSSTGGTKFIINGAGNVGIGTTSPTQLLEMRTAGVLGPVIKLDAAESGAGAWGLVSKASGNSNTGDFGIFDFDGGVYRLNIGSDGDVGIGTTTPWAKLSVTNTGSGPSFVVEDSTSPDTTPFIVTAAGFVGVGTSSPSQELAVAGDLFLSGSIYNQSAITSDRSTSGYVSLTTRADLVNSVTGAAISIVGGDDATDRPAILHLRNQSSGFDYEILVDTDDRLKINSDNSGAGGLNIMTIRSNGLIGIGTSTPISTVSIQGSLCVRSTGSCSNAAGTIYATTAAITDIDLAENYFAFENGLVAGDLVALSNDNQTNNQGLDESFGVKRAVAGSRVLGVVSTAPGILLGKEKTGSVPVALSGRVPVRVNNEGGDIRSGDYVTLSSVSGVGMKATTSTDVVGIALEGYSGSNEGLIMVFVDLGYTRISQELSDGTMVREPWMIDTVTGVIKPVVALNLNNFDISNVKAITSASGNWSISEDGVLIVEEVRTKKLCVGDTCITESDLQNIIDGGGYGGGGDSPEPDPDTDPQEDSDTPDGDNDIPPDDSGDGSSEGEQNPPVEGSPPTEPSDSGGEPVSDGGTPVDSGSSGDGASISDSGGGAPSTE